jgi:hypothetical protein
VPVEKFCLAVPNLCLKDLIVNESNFRSLNKIQAINIPAIIPTQNMKEGASKFLKKLIKPASS